MIHIKVHLFHLIHETFPTPIFHSFVKPHVHFSHMTCLLQRRGVITTLLSSIKEGRYRLSFHVKITMVPLSIPLLFTAYELFSSFFPDGSICAFILYAFIKNIIPDPLRNIRPTRSSTQSHHFRVMLFNSRTLSHKSSVRALL